MNVAVESVSSFALNVTWEPPTDNGGAPILGYVITVNENSIEVAGVTVNFLLSSLMENTTYEYVKPKYSYIEVQNIKLNYIGCLWQQETVKVLESLQWCLEQQRL